MIRAWLMIVFLLAFLSCTSLISTAQWFSKEAVPIWDQIPTGKKVLIVSPDKRKTVSIGAREVGEEGHLILKVSLPRGRIKTADVGKGIGSELLWSPDSRAFSVATSNEGRNGLFHTLVFLVENGSLSKLNIDAPVQRAFGHPVKCGWPELPNVVPISWIHGSRTIIVAAQILHHTNCDSSGTFRAYEVAVPSGKILHSYDQLSAKTLFGKFLGPELASANDDCIRTPRSCEVAYNHEK